MEYRKMIVEGLQKQFPDCDIRIEKIHRNNGQEYDGLCMKLDKDVPYAPIISLQCYVNLLESGKATLDEVLQEIVMQIKCGPRICVPQLNDYEAIKDKLCVRVINYDKNAELLQRIPHRRFLDLAIVYHIMFVIADNMEASMQVTNDCLRAWGVTEEELLDVAYHNTFCATGVRIRRMIDVVYALEKEVNSPLDEVIYNLAKEDSCMFVADTGTPKGGSVSLLMKEAFQQFAEKEGYDVYIIPSSLHELILVLKKEDISHVFLQQMLQEVNHTAVHAEEVLSDHVYLYRRETDEIVDLCQ